MRPRRRLSVFGVDVPEAITNHKSHTKSMLHKTRGQNLKCIVASPTMSCKASIDTPDKTMVKNCQSFDPCFHFSRNMLAISCPSDGKMNSVCARSTGNIAGSDQAKLLPEDGTNLVIKKYNKTHDQCCSLKKVLQTSKNGFWLFYVIRF